MKEGKKLSIHMNTTIVTYQVCISRNILLVKFLLKSVKFHLALGFSILVYKGCVSLVRFYQHSGNF